MNQLASKPGSVLPLLIALLVSTACHHQQPHANLPGTIGGVIVNLQGDPIMNVTVQLPNGGQVLSNPQGEFSFNSVRMAERLAVRFSAPSYVNTTKIFKVVAGTPIRQKVVLLPRAQPVNLDASIGGRVSFGEGGGITISPQSLAAKDGKPLSGNVAVSATFLDVSNPNQIGSAPGDFTSQRGTEIQSLESFGMAEIYITDAAGNQVELLNGKSARLDLPIPESYRGRAPRTLGSYSFDPVSGRWVLAGELVLVDDLMYSGTISRLDYSWNADDPLDTTCITVKVIRVIGNPKNLPIANARVEVMGKDYGSVSIGYTNSQGLVCLLVKRSAALLINAYSPAAPTFPVGPLGAMSPNIASGAADCGNPQRCPLVATLEIDF